MNGADRPMVIEQELNVIPYGMTLSEESAAESTVSTTASGVVVKQKLKLAVAESVFLNAINPSSNCARFNGALKEPVNVDRITKKSLCRRVLWRSRVTVSLDNVSTNEVVSGLRRRVP